MPSPRRFLYNPLMNTTWIPITDLNIPELDIYARLSEVQLLRHDEPAPGIFIAETAKVIDRALSAGYEPISLLADEALTEQPEIREVLSRCPQVPVYTASSQVLRELNGFPLTRGLLCALRRRPLPLPSEICAHARRIAVLEHVTNPTNAGAIFRSAAALGIDAVLLTPDCTDPLYRRAARVSMGTVFQVPWTILDGKLWQEKGPLSLRELGFTTAALALREDSISIDDPCLKEAPRLALLLGAEGDGLSPETIARCDHTVLIPMAHGVDSLNVAAASAVAFWEILK